MYLIGYDIGSSSIKTALVRADNQEVIGISKYPEQEMGMISRQRGWAEQEPETWWKNLCLGTKNLIAQYHINPKEIKGIGISYQMHGLVAVNSDLQVLRPSIIWCDSRAVSIGQQAFKELGEDYCLKNFLNSPGNFTASKIKWVKDNEPTVYQKIHKILLPGDFIAMKLTGELSTTISGLSEGVLWDFKKKKLATPILNHYGIDPSIIADIAPTFSLTGKVNQTASEQTGLAIGTPVTYRAGDQPNNALSLNVLNQGEVAATGGTSGVVYGIVDKPIYDQQSRVNAFAHVNYENNFDRIGVLLCINGAGIQYSWIKHQVALSGKSYNDIEQMASTVPVGSEGICLLPFGNGSERIFNDRNLDAHITNVAFNRHTRAHLYRASLEGIAFSFIYGINLLKSMDIKVDILKVGNDNMFQSKIFSNTISTLLGSQIEVFNTTGAIGAAHAAGVAIGIYDTIEDALQDIQPETIFEPKLNYDSCSQAYNSWLASLNKVLDNSNGKGNSSNTKRLRDENQTYKKELKNKHQIIISQAAQINSQNQLFSLIKKSISSLEKSNNDPNVQKEIKDLKKLIRAEQNIEQTQEVFEEHFDLLNDNFIQQINASFPTLSFEDLKMCALLKLKLSTKEIATQLNISDRGVETKRYRLRKKFNLPKGMKLVQFFEQL